MGLSLRNLTRGIAADLNFRDNGKSHGNMQGRPRPQALPPQKVQLPIGGFGNAPQQFPINHSPAELIQRPAIAFGQQNQMDEKTKLAVDHAGAEFQWTPQFRDVVESANPTITDKLDSSGLTNKVKAAGTYSNFGQPLIPGVPALGYKSQQKLSLAPEYADPFVATHEGLHALFNDKPEVQAEFAKAYNQSVKQDPGIAQYLANRTKDYATNLPGAGQDFSDFYKLNPSMQTEIHSYLSEVPTYTNKQLPAPLAKYYARFINPNVRNTNKTVHSIREAIGDVKPRWMSPQEDQ